LEERPRSINDIMGANVTSFLFCNPPYLHASK
jgi:hypothetical protein